MQQNFATRRPKSCRRPLMGGLAGVDTDNPQHQNILQSLGLNPMDLAKQFLGGKGIPGF